MILVIDDDAAIRSALKLLLTRSGYEVEMAASASEAMQCVRRSAPQLMLMDMNFSRSTSGDEGLTLLRQVKLFVPQVPVILMTAWGSIELAVQGMQAGAFDFITKPWNNVLLLERIRTALELSKTEAETDTTAVEADSFDRSLIVGRSAAIDDILRKIRRIASTTAPVLIVGESGTGKELIAETLHRNSQRQTMPFVKVNLGGVSQSLFESEMFGHKKGAFTDAYTDRIGRFAMADGGTIFLDEIGELDLSCQVKLLRVLQEQTFEVLGDSRPQKSDFRVVCATNANLAEMVRQRTFREDLFYRINLITIEVPPLRQRREDIPLLARHFADRLCQQNGLPKVDFSASAEKYLMQQPFPGNVRELKNLVERTLLVCDNTTLTADDFEAQPSAAIGQQQLSTDGMTLDSLERTAVLRAWDKHQHNVSKTAQELGLSRAALYRRLEKYGLQPDKE